MRRPLAIAAIALALLLTGICTGQQPGSVDTHLTRQSALLQQISAADSDQSPIDTSAVVRIQCGSSVGSGCYLGQRLILSCAHLSRGEGTTSVSVRFPDGSSHTGAIIKVDRQWDQSLIRLDTTPRHIGIRIASSNPEIGDTVVAIGYDYGRSLRRRIGRVIRRVTSRVGQPADWFDVSTQVISGCSGGPVLNHRGEVIGNLWGAAPGKTVANSTGRTQAFLGEHMASLTAYWASWGIRRGCGPQLRPSPGSGSPTPTEPQQPPQIELPEGFVAEIVAKLKSDPEFVAACKGEPGVDGQDGQDGCTGPAGPPGRDGTDGADAEPVDVDKLAQAIRVALPGITVTTRGRDGQEILLGDVRLGEVLELPPITARALDHDGQPIDTERVPLGGQLDILPPKLDKTLKVKPLDGATIQQAGGA